MSTLLLYLIFLVAASASTIHPNYEKFKKIEARSEKSSSLHANFLMNNLRTSLEQSNTDWRWLEFLHNRIKERRADLLPKTQELIRESIGQKNWDTYSPQQREKYYIFLAEITITDKTYGLSLLEEFIKKNKNFENPAIRKLFEVFFPQLQFLLVTEIFETHKKEILKQTLEDVQNLHEYYCVALRMIGEAKRCLLHLTSLQTKTSPAWITLKQIETQLVLGELADARLNLQKVSGQKEDFCNTKVPKDLEREIFDLAATYYISVKDFTKSENCYLLIKVDGENISEFFHSYNMAKLYLLKDFTKFESVFQNSVRQQESLKFPFFDFLVKLQKTRFSMLDKKLTTEQKIVEIENLEKELSKTNAKELALSLPMMKQQLKAGSIDKPSEKEQFELSYTRMLIEKYFSVPVKSN